jgi:hypothetical protein
MMNSKNYITRALTLFALTLILFQACKTEELKNPYDEIERGGSTGGTQLAALPDTNFAWLHEKIFRPTCANSGCHDGTFEPEFRTIASAYNSLVNHPVIANNPAMSFEYRVVPGNAGASWLHERITTEVENTSGRMPLYPADTLPDWIANKNLYIQKITDWINNGAKDMYGNPAPVAGANAAPLVYGMNIYPAGNTSTAYQRDPNSTLPPGSLLVSPTLVDVWVVAFDDNAGLTNFASFSIKMSDSLSDFSESVEIPCVLSSPISGLDFTGNPANFYYKATLDLTGIPVGETRYLRAYVSDGITPLPMEVPNASSNYFWYLLFSMKMI